MNVHFKDNEKLIYITSAGGQIPNQLAEHGAEFEDVHSAMKKLAPKYEVEVNPDLSKFLTFSDREKYLSEFVEMAQRGFYSYDKTKVGLDEDPLFHIVAWPKTDDNNVISDTNALLSINKSLPANYSPFNLFDYFTD